MARQLTLDAARGIELKEDAMECMEKAKDRVFLDTMRDHGRHLSLLHGSVSTDDIRKAADEYGLTPRSPNVYGCIFRGSHWVEVGRKYSEYESNHGREIRIWRYLE